MKKRSFFVRKIDNKNQRDTYGFLNWCFFLHVLNGGQKKDNKLLLRIPPFLKTPKNEAIN